jgi:hypothetical protein
MLNQHLTLLLFYSVVDALKFSSGPFQFYCLAIFQNYVSTICVPPKSRERGPLCWYQACVGERGKLRAPNFDLLLDIIY